MTNPIVSLIDKFKEEQVIPRLRTTVIGLAQDFWKDGSENPLHNLKILESLYNRRATSHSFIQDVASTPSAKGLKPAKPAWHALPGEISEKMWGPGCVTPGDDVISDMLILPLSINKDMSVLDLSAGLGSRLRRTVDKFGVYITGLEPDPEIAVRGMELSVKAGKGKRAVIAAYDPNNFKHSKLYNCIIARETFYRVKNKDKFFKAIADCSQPKAHLSFTDYIVDPQNREKPGVKSWMAFEKDAQPFSADEMKKSWAKVGYDVRVRDDQTNLYRMEVFQGLKRLVDFMNSGVVLDEATQKAVSRRLLTWQNRLDALNAGMRFYRFFAIKEG